MNPDEGRGQCVRPTDPCTTVLLPWNWKIERLAAVADA
jgi:hypothetical protein